MIIKKYSNNPAHFNSVEFRCSFIRLNNRFNQKLAIGLTAVCLNSCDKKQSIWICFVVLIPFDADVGLSWSEDDEDDGDAEVDDDDDDDEAWAAAAAAAEA